jgi:hypothetical protein
MKINEWRNYPMQKSLWITINLPDEEIEREVKIYTSIDTVLDNIKIEFPEVSSVVIVTSF